MKLSPNAIAFLSALFSSERLSIPAAAAEVVVEIKAALAVAVAELQKAERKPDGKAKV